MSCTPHYISISVYTTACLTPKVSFYPSPLPISSSSPPSSLANTLYLSVCFYLVGFAHLLCLRGFFFLYPTYKWNHTIFVFLCLTYFGWCNILKVHLCHKWQDFTFYSWVIFHCVGLSVCVDKYRYTGITSSMSIHLSMGTWSVSISWLLWKKCC